MSESFGSGVSRTLSALQRQFQTVVWQKNRPPLDSELCLMSQIDLELSRNLIRSQMHSGFLLDPTQSPRDFVCAPQWSNFFDLGRQDTAELDPIVWANINGWIIPVTGTGLPDSNTSNRVRLNPPPDSDARIDLVFLEAWATLVAPNPADGNKPSTSTVWKYGNVEFGGTNVTDDIEDPTIGFETTERVQVQYRIRVFGQGAGLGSSVALDVYTDGLDDPNILGQGTSTSPIAGFAFTNMREAMNDPGLWRAGDGDAGNSLGTTNGFTYAVPIAAIFRRNSSPFAAVESSGNANQNGGLDRNPSAAFLPDPRDGAKVLSSPTLTNAISESTLVTVIAVTGLADSGFDDPNIDLSSTFIILDGEVLGPLTAVGGATVTVASGTSRGRNGTMAVPHEAGTSVRFFNPRSDGFFADQIAITDVLDLRHGVTLGDWDYQQLLVHNLSALVQNRLRTTYKQSAAGGETQGVQVVEIGYMLADGATAVPNATVAVDGPDGVRTIFSDSAALQPDVTILCDEVTAVGPVASLDAGVEWDVAADFQPQGFITGTGYTNGTIIYLDIGGTDGNSGARGTFRDSGTRAVRFVAPSEFWKADFPDETTGLQGPVKIRWLETGATQPAAYAEASGVHPGPLYPTKDSNFERPFIVLGGVLNALSQIAGSTVVNNSPGVGDFEVDLPGVDFDTAGSWWNGTDITSTDVTGITNTVLRGQRTLYDMLTQGGQDATGRSSEVYLILRGDTANPGNNGVFQVIGAGTAGYTFAAASASDRIRVRFMTSGMITFTATANTYTAELRSQHINAEDGPGGSASGIASTAIVFTDINGTSPWAGLLPLPIQSKMVITTTLQYHPGRGATARVADNIWRVAGLTLGNEYLRQSPTALDSTFPYLPDIAETYFDPSHAQTWNRLPSLGLTAPRASDYGGGVAVSSEQTREAEAFIDRGSKTLIFRPFLNRSMTMQSRTSTAGVGDTLLGPVAYPGPVPPAATQKDGLGLWTAGKHMGFEVPPEFMPRFGRQDIPYFDGDGTGIFLPGVNHLFTDSLTTSDPVFSIIGGYDNSGVAGVNRMLVQTGSTSGLAYGQFGTIAGADSYQGRLMSTSAVISSDLGRGMKGIQLPPYLGIARVYGVFDRRNFVAVGGATFTNRVTPVVGGATNLLRKDATKQTLFILQDGAQDATGSVDDHTYIVPENAIDITLSPTYVNGETFEDLEYVVEFCCFGFARGFINLNNYVLARLHSGAGGGAISDGSAIELEPIRMTIPSPSPIGDAVYVGFTRTPYQGDPYMTRAGSTRVTSDYEARYGQVPTASQYLLTDSIQQFDSNGDLIPQTPNRRALEVLAAFDFYTTLGTGKVGGSSYAGTPLDCGYTEDTNQACTRLPESASAPAWRVVPRGFSAGQLGNASHASLGVEVFNNALVGGKSITFRIPNQMDVTLVGGVDYVVGPNATITATNIVGAIVANPVLPVFLIASNTGTTIVTLVSIPVGTAGNQIRVIISDPNAFRLQVPLPPGSIVEITSAYLAGGVDINANAGNGTSQIDLTGMTERLPMGILVQDSDLICDNPLGDEASAMVTLPSGIQPVQSLLPLSSSGQEYTRFLGGPGQWVTLSDGGILQYEAFSDAVPTGTKKFRLFRGGGAAFMTTDPVAGAPIDWVAGSLPASLEPVLKGGVLICKALLVRNLAEEAFSTPQTTSHGDEVEMVILTYGVLGRAETRTEGLTLSGVISPTGYGEGYAAADRYRLEGHPLVIGHSRVAPNTDAEPAVFPGDGADPPETAC